MIRAIKSSFILLFLSFFTLSCNTPMADQGEPPSDKVYQYSTIKALLEGLYDGDLNLGDLKKQGDLGIGTFNALDGEMVVLNDTVYQVKSDGRVYLPADSVQTPYATLAAFETDTSFQVNGPVNYVQLRQFLDEQIPGKNGLYAFKITGEFRELKVRSVPRQSPPYLPLDVVVKNQTMFGFQSIKGTLLGFYFPEYLAEISVPGYHLHFISEDRSQGGHVLFFEGISASIEMDELTGLNLVLPTHEAFKNQDLSQDRKKELEQVEQLNQ